MGHPRKKRIAVDDQSMAPRHVRVVENYDIFDENEAELAVSYSDDGSVSLTTWNEGDGCILPLRDNERLALIAALERRPHEEVRRILESASVSKDGN